MLKCPGILIYINLPQTDDTLIGPNSKNSTDNPVKLKKDYLEKGGILLNYSLHVSSSNPFNKSDCYNLVGKNHNGRKTLLYQQSKENLIEKKGFINFCYYD
jgi:hypothetical protein